MSEAQAGGSSATTRALPSAARSSVTPAGIEAGSGRLKRSRGKSGDEGDRSESPGAAIRRGSAKEPGRRPSSRGGRNFGNLCVRATLLSRGRHDVVKPPIPSNYGQARRQGCSAAQSAKRQL